MSLSATQLRAGMIIKHRDAPHRILDLTHVTPGNWRGFVRTKLRNLRTGLQTEHRFRSEAQVERLVLDQREMEYLYQAGNEYHFMDAETYEQFALPHADLTDALPYLQPNASVQVLSVNGKPSSLQLPASVELEVVGTEPGVRGDTVSNVTKPATLETGAVVQVPMFVNVGDRLKVDPREGRYISRA